MASSPPALGTLSSFLATLTPPPKPKQPVLRSTVRAAPKPRPNPYLKPPLKPQPQVQGKGARGLTDKQLTDIRTGKTPYLSAIEVHDPQTRKPKMSGDEFRRKAAPIQAALKAGKIDQNETTRRYIAAGLLLPMPAEFHETNPIIKTVHGLSDAVIGMPAGTYKTVKGLATDPVGTVKGIAKGAYESTVHPHGDYSSIILNILAGKALLSGGITRTGAVQGAVREGVAGGLAAPGDLGSAIGKLSKADARVYSVLVDPGKHLGSIDHVTAQRLAAPSKALTDLLGKDPHLASVRTQALEAIGKGKIVPRQASPVGAAVREAGASRAGQIGKAVLKTPEPKARQLVYKGPDGKTLTVGRVGSKDAAINLLQRQVIDRAKQRQLDRTDAPQPSGLMIPVSKHFSAETTVGRELATQRAIQDAIELAPVSALDRFGKTKPARVLGYLSKGKIDAAKLIGKPDARLSAAENKAVDIVATGQTAAENMAEHAHNLSRGIGKASDQKAQMALVTAAMPHLDALARGEHPKLAQAIEESRAVSRKREGLIGMSPDAAAHRIGGRATEIQAGAAGHASPLERISQIESQLKKEGFQAPKPKDTDSLEQYLAKQRAWTTAQLQKTHEKLVANLDLQHRPFTGTDPGLNVQALKAEESQLRTRMDQLQRHADVQDIHRQITAEGHLAVERGAFYVPAKTLMDAVKVGSPGRINVSKFGLRTKAKPLPELSKQYTGALQRTGNFRTDVPGLVGDSYRRAQRYASIQRGLNQIAGVAYDTIEKAGGDRWALPVRTTAKVPEELRAFVQQADRGPLSKKEAESLHVAELEEYIRSVFPNPELAKAGKIKGVKWVDSRLLAKMTSDANQSWGKAEGLGKLFDTVNAPFRASLLYTKPSYAINLIQNIATNVVQQGVFTPVNITRALRLGKDLGAEDQHLLFQLVGAGKSRSIEPGSGVGKTALHAAGEFWNGVTDRYPRVASMLHEMRREGFNTPEKIHTLLHSDHPSIVAKRDVIVRRANKEAVEYGNLTPFERNVVKRALFFYPWMRGATLYSLRFPIEHPVQAATGFEIGRQGSEDTKRILGRVPSYMEGVFPAMGGLVNPTNVNTPGTAVETAQALTGPFIPGSLHAGDIAQALGPAAGAINTLLSGNTGLGFKIPSTQSRVGAVLQDLEGDIPASTLLQRLGVISGPSSPKAPQTNPAKQPIYQPGPYNAIGKFGGGGLFPARYSKTVLNAKGEAQYVAGLAPKQKAVYQAYKTQQKAVADAKQLYKLKVLPSPQIPDPVAKGLVLRRAYKIATADTKSPTLQQRVDALVTAAKTVRKNNPGALQAALVIQRAPADRQESYLATYWHIYGVGQWTATVNHYLGQTSTPSPQPSVVQQATQQYPALAKYTGDVAFRTSPADKTGRSLEFYPKGERDSFAPDRPAVELFGNKADATGIAGDLVSHYLARGADPALTDYYKSFVSSMTSQQKATLQEQYRWAQTHEGEKRPFAKWADVSGLPAYFRGYAFKQWPDAKSYYTPEQIKMFDTMMAYLRKG